MRNLSTLALAVLLLVPTSARSGYSLAATPACRSAVEIALSGYGACDMTARSKHSRRPDSVKLAADLEKCRTKFEGKFFSALGRNGSENCTTETSAAFGTYLDGCVAAASEAAGGAALPATPAPTATPAPATPTPDVTPTPTPTPCVLFSVNNGKGGTYTDNCNGTVTDSTSGLVWEQKTDDGGVHDWDNTYSWTLSDDPWSFDGTAASLFLATLNTAPCFAGACDWRLPTVIELGGQELYGTATGGIVDLTVPGCTGGVPCINAIFGPTVSSYYWSSSTSQLYPNVAWNVDFDSGYVSDAVKTNYFYARAVRSGL